MGAEHRCNRGRVNERDIRESTATPLLARSIVSQRSSPTWPRSRGRSRPPARWCGQAKMVAVFWPTVSPSLRRRRLAEAEGQGGRGPERPESGVASYQVTIAAVPHRSQQCKTCLLVGARRPPLRQPERPKTALRAGRLPFVASRRRSSTAVASGNLRRVLVTIPACRCRVRANRVWMLNE
jgi:hypothetical protein